MIGRPWAGITSFEMMSFDEDPRRDYSAITNRQTLYEKNQTKQQCLSGPCSVGISVVLRNYCMHE